MIDLFTLNKMISKSNVETCLEKLRYQKKIEPVEACIIITYVCKDRLGLINTMKILRSIGVEELHW